MNLPESYIEDFPGTLLTEINGHDTVRGCHVLRQKSCVVLKVIGRGNPAACIQVPLKIFLPHQGEVIVCP